MRRKAVIRLAMNIIKRNILEIFWILFIIAGGVALPLIWQARGIDVIIFISIAGCLLAFIISPIIGGIIFGIVKMANYIMRIKNKWRIELNDIEKQMEKATRNN